MTDRLTALLHEVDGVDVRVPGPAPVRSRGRQLRRRRQAAAATGGAGLALAAVLGVGLLSGEQETSLRQLPADAPPTAVLPSEAPRTLQPSPPPASPAAGPTAAPRGEDSREPGYLVGFEDGGDALLVRVDRVQVLTGAEAEARAAATGGEVPVPNDQLVVNDNPQVRTYPVAVDARVTITNPLSSAPPDAPDSVTVEGLRSLLPGVADPTRIPFRVTVEDGVVVALDQVYVP